MLGRTPLVEDAPELGQPPASVGIDPVEAARTAIWQLFEDGLLDENMATAGLLAVDVGMRRSGIRDTEPRSV
jgi:hypothetical protein